jgi:hypothetical protein
MFFRVEFKYDLFTIILLTVYTIQRFNFYLSVVNHLVWKLEGVISANNYITEESNYRVKYWEESWLITDD